MTSLNFITSSLESDLLPRVSPRSPPRITDVPSGNGTVRSGSADVFIAGSGPIGATFAVELHRLNPSLRIFMVDVGPLNGPVPAGNKKNDPQYGQDPEKFVEVINEDLRTCKPAVITRNLDPSRPDEENIYNLDKEATTQVVGGMSTHWTCSCPRLHPTLERPRLVVDEDDNDRLWESLYTRAEELIGVNKDVFQTSIRHQLVMKTLRDSFPEREFESIPTACHLNEDDATINWHSANTVFQMFGTPLKVEDDGSVTAGDFFRLQPEMRCTKIIPRRKSHQNIDCVELTDMSKDTTRIEDIRFFAKVFIIAAGAVGTPQILVNSATSGDFVAPKGLGHYITEQGLSFCQVVLHPEITDSLRAPQYPLQFGEDRVYDHISRNPQDSVAIPGDDLAPQVTTSVGYGHPWHTQIHREIFAYGGLSSDVDKRLAVDLRFFSRIEPTWENTLTFDPSSLDLSGMPLPKFHFRITTKSLAESQDMLNEMVKMADALGTYIPGSKPKLMEPGVALHLAGTTRAMQPGINDTESNSVTDTYSKLLGWENVFLGGNGLIPTAYAANPTLTSMAYAIRSAEYITSNWSDFSVNPNGDLMPFGSREVLHG